MSVPMANCKGEKMLKEVILLVMNEDKGWAYNICGIYSETDDLNANLIVLLNNDILPKS